MTSQTDHLNKKIGKLTKSEQFDFVLQSRNKIGTKHFVLHFSSYKLSTDLGTDDRPCVNNLIKEGLFLGLVIPKRWIKSAVRRSLIKRSCRIQFALFSSVLPLGAYVVRLKQGFDASLWTSASSEGLKKEIREELHCLFSQAKYK